MTVSYYRYSRCAMCGGMPVVSSQRIECPRCGISVTYGERMVRPAVVWAQIQYALIEEQEAGA